MKREERNTLNALRKNINRGTINVEVPTTYTHEGRQEIHRILTLEKGFVAVRIYWNDIRNCTAVHYIPASTTYGDIRPLYADILREQETMDIDTITANLPDCSGWTWNGYRAPGNEEEPTNTTTNDNTKEDETMNTTTNTTASAIFPHLYAEIGANYDKRTSDLFHYIERGYMPSWAAEHQTDPDRGLKQYSTARRWEQYQRGEITREQAERYAKRRAIAEVEKYRAAKLARIESAAAAPVLDSASVSVTWAKSRTWGANPTAELLDGRSVCTTGHASGCGYDKESSAIAEAMNNNPSALRVLYELGEKALERGESPKSKTACSGYSWGNCIGYGAGYDVLPYYEGGVGSDCFWSILNKAGYTVRHAGSGKMYDCWTFYRA